MVSCYRQGDEEMMSRRCCAASALVEFSNSEMNEEDMVFSDDETLCMGCSERKGHYQM